MNPYYDNIYPESISGAQLDHALSLGWYRSNQKIFTCSHVDLNGVYQVHWLRYKTTNMQDRASHKKLKSRNKDFLLTIDDFDSVGIREDHRQLYKRYREFITFDGADSIEDSLFGEDDGGVNIFTTKCISVFDQGKLIAGGYFDLGDQSAASILHFFDPEYARYSLGRFLILITIDYLKTNGYSFYYPGYVVQGLPKMNYKLFLGKEFAEYFDPSSLSWKPFHDDLLIGSPIDLDQFRNQLINTGNESE